MVDYIIFLIDLMVMLLLNVYFDLFNFSRVHFNFATKVPYVNSVRLNFPHHLHKTIWCMIQLII